jgi:predicted TPR repeat methyltransferase
MEGKMQLQDCKINFPKNADRLDQDEEWILLTSEDQQKKVRLHDYGEIYNIPGLYEEVVYTRLKCDSPQVICSILKEELAAANPEALRVLDFGAGNGMVGECLEEKIGCEALVGIDIIPEAVSATCRDRPGLYDDYYVMDLCDIGKDEEDLLAKWRFNTLVTIAALGYGDIPSRAFINAFNLLEDGSWIAFNIKDRFLTEEDGSGFKETLDNMFDHCLQILQSERYCHRLSMSGEPLHYVAVVGRKIHDVKLLSS